MAGEGTAPSADLPITGSCHCGAVTYEMKTPPRHAVECNCSICRRLGTVWGHGEARDITVTAAPDTTLSYSWGRPGPCLPHLPYLRLHHTLGQPFAERTGPHGGQSAPCGPRHHRDDWAQAF